MKRNRFQYVVHNNYPTVLDAEQNRVASFWSENKTRWLVDQFNAGRINPEGFEWDRLDTSRPND